MYFTLSLLVLAAPGAGASHGQVGAGGPVSTSIRKEKWRPHLRGREHRAVRRSDLVHGRAPMLEKLPERFTPRDGAGSEV
ncbi:hypothetical protein ABZ260_04790 [Streptosporangium sp. NPDC006013]|uniref:hypothetical protein n=1 Tax=Streptosporangium sp. NPDC006013 TaxID=3155596 RepID=UPI0033AD8B40